MLRFFQNASGALCAALLIGGGSFAAPPAFAETPKGAAKVTRADAGKGAAKVTRTDAGKGAAKVTRADATNINALTLLIDFPVEGSDKTLWETAHPDLTADAVHRLLNDPASTNILGNVCSVSRYFRHFSGGKLEYRNFVAGPYVVSHPRSYYDSPGRDVTSAARELIGEAIALMRADPDFKEKILPDLRQLTRCGNLFRSLNVFFAGETSGHYGKGLWAHRFNLAWEASEVFIPEVGERGAFFHDYQISPLTAKPTMRTFCHETGHTLFNFPDLYLAKPSSVYPIGYYSLMGNKTSDNFPPPIDAFLRVRAGWVEPKPLPESGVVTISTDVSDVYIHRNPKNANEYYLFENVQKDDGFYREVPASGVVIYRCNEAGDNRVIRPQTAFLGFGNAATNRCDFKAAIEQADGLYSIERGELSTFAGDAWHAGNEAAKAANNLTLGADTVPCARWADASPAGFCVSNFSANASVMTFEVKVDAAKMDEAKAVRSRNPKGEKQK